MKVLSKAERENQYRKRADAATRKAASPNTDKRQATLRKIKERLQQLNYVINDEKALEEINKFRIQEGKALIKDICHLI